MDFHISLIGRGELSAEIYRQIRQGIVAGRLQPGQRLPASRALARQLSVARITVTVAYDRLVSEGFACTRVGSGTFVSSLLPQFKPNAASSVEPAALQARALWDDVQVSTAFADVVRYDFRTGLPDATLFPQAGWRRALTRATRDHAFASGVYAHPGGHPALRHAIVHHIGLTRGVAASPDQVIITNGTQQALDIIARVLVEPGETVAVEDPGYVPPRLLFKSLGMNVVGVPVDRDGLIPEALDPTVRMVYTTPSHHYPLGVPMSLPRRLALLEWAARHGAAIVEDDYDCEFRYGGRPIEPIQTLDRTGRVIYVGSFSKTLLPTLRLGFIIAPPSLCPAVHKVKYVSDWHTTMLTQAALAIFIGEGGFARHLRRAHRTYAARHARLVQGLAGKLGRHLDLIPSQAGLHLAARARNASSECVLAVAQRALKLGVCVQPLSRCAINRPNLSGIMLGFGNIGVEDIDEGLARIHTCFEELRHGEDRRVGIGSRSTPRTPTGPA